MIQKARRSSPENRRALSFPAVHPCEGISSSTLISSLISLSDEILESSHLSFPTQRRNVREALRTVNLLRVFFESSVGVLFSDTAILCLSELHLALQRLRYVLEDLSRFGARVWVLAKCDFVASQFRVFANSVSTAIDVLPDLRLAGVESEVAEIVELVGEQSRRAKFELDFEDEKFSDQVFLIMSQLNRKIEPRFSSIKRVLDYLGIKTWFDCNEEVNFLEEEIEFEATDRGEREIPLLSSLFTLMSYSRAVIFEDFDWRRRRTLEPLSDRKKTTVTETLRCLNSSDFRCPISLEIMIDPVTVSTGQTYDRNSIQKWLKSGNTTCPKTGEKLAHTELIPNSLLRRLIRNFLDENNASSSSIASSKPIRKPKENIKFRANLLADFLVRRLVFGSNSAKQKAAFEIKLVSKSSPILRSILVDSGAVTPLINLLSAGDSSEEEENTIAAILRLSKDPSGRVLIVESGGLNPIISVLDRGKSPESKQIAAAIIFYLAASSPENCCHVSDHRRTLPALAELLRNGTSCGKKNSVAAIYALLSGEPSKNLRGILKAKIVPLLVNALTFPYNDALAVLSVVAESAEGASEIAGLGSPALGKIRAVLQGSNSRASKEYCVSVFLSLCENVGDRVTGVLVKDQSLMGLLYSLVTDGTSVASKKARCLIKILHKFRETMGGSSSSSNGSLVGFSQEQSFVRAR